MDIRTTRRGVLLGAGAAGLGGILAACSTAAVPYGAGGSGQVPDDTPPSANVPGASMMATQAAGGTSPSADGPGDGPGEGPGEGTVLGDVADVPVGSGMIYTAEKVVVTQPAQGEYRAFSAVCTHVGCILNKIANGTIDCPCHGSEFTIATGAVVAGPAPAPLPKKKIKIEGGKVILLPG
jgi:Rieske Fe-S protein